MCGSGTFLIEAAWIALRRPPGLTRKWLGFMGWPDFDPGVWSAIRDHARQKMRPRPANRIVGSDLRQDAVHHAARNIKTAGIGHLVDVRQSDFQHLSPPTTVPGLIICNPPYGERLGHDQELIALYQSLGMTIRRHWPGWRFVVFTAADHLAQQIRLKPHRVTAFFNGSLKCRLWEFEPT
jgi:23S rRNA G2445 N2-methylase RlmL